MMHSLVWGDVGNAASKLVQESDCQRQKHLVLFLHGGSTPISFAHDFEQLEASVETPRSRPRRFQEIDGYAECSGAHTRTTFRAVRVGRKQCQEGGIRHGREEGGELLERKICYDVLLGIGIRRTSKPTVSSLSYPFSKSEYHGPCRAISTRRERLYV